MAIEFDGSNRIDVGGWTNPAGAAVSFSFWMMLDTISGTRRPFGAGSHMEIRVVSGKVYNDIYENPGGGTLASTITLSANILYHIVATGDRSITNSKLYVNGVFDHQNTAANGTETGGTTLSLGTRSESSERIDGKLFDFRVYDRVLTLAEIETIYASRGQDFILENLRNRWVFSEGYPGQVASGSVKDLIGNNDGTPVSSPVYAEENILSYVRGVL